MAARNKHSKVISLGKGVLYNAEEEKEHNIIGKRLRIARENAGLSLASLSGVLSSYGVVIAASGLSKWESGRTIPNAYQMLALCNALEIENEVDYFSLRGRLQELNEEGLRKVSEYKADLIASCRYRSHAHMDKVVKYVDMPVSYLTASAGTGAFLDEGNFEMVSFPESAVPNGAEFGLRVSGNSMEPVYHDGQIVWVQRCSTVSPGEVGIFIYDGDGYIKVYDEQEPDEDISAAFTDSYGTVHMQPVMRSYNKDYEPRPIYPNVNFQIVGRVL